MKPKIFRSDNWSDNRFQNFELELEMFLKEPASTNIYKNLNQFESNESMIVIV